MSVPKWMNDRGITPPPPPPKPRRFRGAGDVVHAVAKFTGINAVVKWWTGGNCNCEARRRRLNEWWSFG